MGRKSVGDSEEEEQSSCDVRVGGSLRSTLTRARARKVPSKTKADVLFAKSVPFACDCVRTQIPPASAAWCFSFNLEGKTAKILRYHRASAAWCFSFYLTLHRRSRPKLKHHATKVGGIKKTTPHNTSRLKLKHHAAEARWYLFSQRLHCG